MSNGIISAADSMTARVEAWLHLDDFSPGVYDNSYISTADPILSAPLGAANADNTFCCAALSGGGLGPLPTMAPHGYAESFPGSLTTWWIVGFAVNPGLDNGAPELIFILEGDDGTTHYVLGWSYVPALGDANVILTSDSDTTPGFFGAPYPAWTRMTADGTGNPPPVLVFPSAVVTDSSGDSGHLYEYPNIADFSVFAVGDLIIPGDSTTGQVICYGNRVQVLAGVTYTWPVGSGINTNENINYTDPPQSAEYGDQNTLLAIEEPWGYGTWGSISIGELLLVKKFGGAVVLNGDISDPNSVIPLPGVISTGDFVGSSDASSIGLTYCSQNRGAWLWNGGNTSQKISGQLRDNFYDMTTPLNFASNNYGFFVGHWQNWILFSNNFMFDSDTGAWWVLYPTTGNGNSEVTGEAFFWYEPGPLGYQMYAVPLQIGTGPGQNLSWYYLFDNRTPAPHWQWESLPIHVTPTADRLIDIRQVVIRVSNPFASTSEGSTVRVTIGDWTETTGSGIPADITAFRFNVGVGALGIEDIVIKIQADDITGLDGASAPILHSIDVGFNYRASLATSD